MEWGGVGDEGLRKGWWAGSRRAGDSPFIHSVVEAFFLSRRVVGLVRGVREQEVGW